jgi:transposase
MGSPEQQPVNNFAKKLSEVGGMSKMGINTHRPGTNTEQRHPMSEFRSSPQATRFGTQRTLRMPTTQDGSTIRYSPCRSKRVVWFKPNNRRRTRMKGKYAALVGLDWADEKHDLCVLETATGKEEKLVLEHKPERINEWVIGMIAKYPGQRIAICLEQSRGPLVYSLMGYPEIDLYPMNPACLASYRKSVRNSGAKDDPTDAALLLDRLLRHPETLKVWRPDTEEMRLLSSLCRDRRKIVDLRTKLVNMVLSKLKEYYPQAVSMVGGNLYSELACAFLMKWPDFKRLASTDPDKIRRFYYKMNCRSEKALKERLELIAGSCPITTDKTVIEANTMLVKTLIGQVRSLNRSIESYDKSINDLFREHPDAFIFKSFPGAGKQQAPRLMTAFGSDRDRYENAREISTFIGVAPVIERSGKKSWTHWRWHAPKFLRQSVVEFAGSSIVWCAWAKIYYQKQKERGKQHNVAVRALAFKWMRILFKCWQDRVPYDEQKYLAALEQHGSWLAEAVKKAA